MQINRYLSPLLGAVIALAALAAPHQAAAQSNSLTKVTVIMPNPPSGFMIPYYVAQDAGFYKDAGLDVEIKTVSGDQNAIRAVLTGAGDVAVIGFPVLYEAVLHGGTIRGIGGGNQTLADYFLVLGKGKGTTLKDVVGKKLAISTPGSMPQLYPEMLLRAKGIDPAGTQYVAVGGLAARLQAVVAGKVDGSVIDTLNSLIGEHAGEITAVADANRDLPEKLGYEMSIATQAALNDPVKRKAIYALTKATIQGARRTVEQPDAAAESLYKRMHGDQKLDLLKETVKSLNDEKIWGLNGGVERKLHDETIKVYLEHNLVSEPVAYEKAFDPSLVDQAIKELGTQEGGWW